MSDSHNPQDTQKWNAENRTRHKERPCVSEHSEQTTFLTPSGLLAARKILNCFYDWPAPAQSRAELSQHDTVTSPKTVRPSFSFNESYTTMFYGDQGFKYPAWNKIYCWVMIIVLDSDAEVRIFNSSQKMRDIFWSSGLNILSGPLARLSWSRALIPPSASANLREAGRKLTPGHDVNGQKCRH